MAMIMGNTIKVGQRRQLSPRGRPAGWTGYLEQAFA
jgi:hypothetical protein